MTASQIIGKAALKQDVNVTMSEVHGMAQRGGVVTCSVRLGDFKSPLIANGEADVLLGFEPVETYRALNKANEKSWVITNTNPIVPFTVSAGSEEYPPLDEIFSEMKDKISHLVMVDATEKAQEAGAAITANVVLVGALSACEAFPFDTDLMKKTVLELVPDKYREVNEKAFELGTKQMVQ